MEFYTKYNRPEPHFEKNDGVTLVERSGYVDAKIRIENLITAGRRLTESRNVLYDSDNSFFDENYYDITRSPNLDIADVSQLKNAVEGNFTASALKASQTAQDAAQSDLKVKDMLEVPVPVAVPPKQS